MLKMDDYGKTDFEQCLTPAYSYTVIISGCIIFFLVYLKAEFYSHIHTSADST